MQIITTMTDLSPGEFALVGFASFWALVGLGIITTATYFWLKERSSTVPPHFRSRRRRRV